MLNKLIKKLRTCDSRNRSFPLLSKSRKCKTKRAPVKIKVFSDKNNKLRSDDSNSSNFKKIIKFLSPKTERRVKKEEIKVEVNRESINANSKNSQDSGWVEITRSSSRSSLIIGHRNFSTSSPVFNRKQLNNFCLNYNLEMDFEVEAIPKIDCTDIEPIQLLNKSDLSCSTIGSEETGINVHFEGHNSTIVNSEADLVRANSDSEILPLMDARDDPDFEVEFTSNYNILSQSFPATCNSTRREYSNKLMKCIIGLMFANEFREKSAEESSIFVDQNLFASFDQSLKLEEEVQKNPMRDTLIEISTRRQSFSDNISSNMRIMTINENVNNNSSSSSNLSNDVNISLPKSENYECGKKFDLVKISEGVEAF